MGTPLNVLIVEDSRDDAELLVRHLCREGYEVTHRRVENGDELRAALDEERWQVVISDHNLPDFDSQAALAGLRASGWDLPFIIVSGTIGEDLAVEAMRAGAHDYILKSNLTRLVPAIQRELREAEIRQARQVAESMLSFHSSHDALTGLLNRGEFEKRVATALELARGHHRRFALCFIDLDAFRLVNDTCGNAGGDELLRQVAAGIRAATSYPDVLARLGGDEFCLLLQDFSADDARQRAEKVLAEISRLRFQWLEHVFDVTASIGVVALGPEARAVDDVLSAASVACAAAKERGGRRVHSFQVDDELLARRRDELQWVPRLVSAVESNRLRLFHQRIRPLQPEASPTDHCEMLVRLEEEAGRMVLPGEFIPAAERYRVMPLVDRWVVDAALALLARRREAQASCPPCVSFINISGTSLSDERVARDVAELMERHAVPSDSVCFEITETAVIRDLRAATAFIHEMRSLGCRFALDDFGSGVSSYAYLKQLPVSFIKIDGTFVREMASDALAFAIVQSIQQVARAVGLQTIAESVEDATTLEMVSGLGIDFAQGYFIHRPESTASFA